MRRCSGSLERWTLRGAAGGVPAEDGPHRPKRVTSACRLEVVLRHVVDDLVAEHRSQHVRGAEVDAAPDARVDDLLQRVGETVEGPGRTGAGRHLLLIAVKATLSVPKKACSACTVAPLKQA